MAKVNSVSWGSRVLKLSGAIWRRHLPKAIALFSFLSVLPTEIKAAELPEIEARGHLKVAVKDNLRPLGFEDPEGNLQGFEIDLARRLAAEILGDADAVKLEPVANTERLDVVLTGEVDLTIAQVSQTKARSRIVSFSPHYYLDRVSFVTKVAKIKKKDDLSQAKIAILNESSTIAEVRFKFPEAELIGVDSYQEALSLLEDGKATAFAGDQTVLVGWVQEYPQYRLLPQQIGGEGLAVVMPKGLQYSSLHQIVNQTIRELRESGWLEKKAAEWGLDKS